MSTLTANYGNTVSTAGGTAKTLTEESRSATKVVFVDLTEVDYRLREKLTLTVKNPAVFAGAPNGYSQARTSVVHQKPVLLANGKYTMTTVRFEFAADVSITPANRLTALDQVLGVLCQTLARSAVSSQVIG